MRLTVVGCAAGWGHGSDAASSCYLVENGETAIVLDLGQGSFARLAEVRAPERLRAVLVTHLHPDHCVDLIPLRHYLRYEADAAPGTVTLHGPAELPARFDAFVNEPRFLADLSFLPLAPGEIRVGNLVVTAGRVTHADDSFAFRVAGEGVPVGFVYSGDCGDPADLVALVRPGDTLISEAYFGAAPVTAGVPHLDAAGAARAARDGQAGRLVLTHLHPAADPAVALRQAESTFGGETVLARPGLVLRIS